MSSITPARALAALTAAALLGVTAQASQQSVSDSVPLTLTNWQDTLTIPQFNTSLGTLNAVTIRFETNIEGQIGVENTSPNSQDLTATLQATIRLLAPDNSQLIESIPSSNYDVPPLGPFDNVVDFGGTSGNTSPLLTDAEVASVPIPPRTNGLTLASFEGNGTLTFPVSAQGSSFFTGNTGNEASLFQLRAAARLVVTYDYTPPESPCGDNPRDVPASLLLYPRFDNTPGNLTLVTVTNTNCDFNPLPNAPTLQAGTVDVEFVYIGRYGHADIDLPCLETNITRRLSPCDTLTVVTLFDNPNTERGFLYVFAKDPQTGQAIVWNHLIGQAMFLGGGDIQIGSPARDALNARPFLGIGAERSATDHDGDDVRDLDGVEYSEAPDEILIPRFLGQTGGGLTQVFDSRLVLVGLSGGVQFTTTVYILSYNDNEEQFSSQYSFRCWADPRLSEINGAFLESFLDSTFNAPDEIVGASQKESGWLRIDGLIASSSADSISDPAIYAVLFERMGNFVVADLPWELCTQDNGDLFPKDLFDEN